MLTDNHLALLRLTLVSGLGPRLTSNLLQTFGNPITAVDASTTQLQQVEGIGSKSAADIRRQLDNIDVEKEIALIQQHNVTLLTIDEDAYPPLLKKIYDPPALLYVRGQFQRTDSVALAIVGSRQCSAYGQEQAARFAGACSSAGLTIVSGGARGIDSAAHRAALAAGGRTIAVLGCGLANVYPPENAELFEQIASTTGGAGAVISELPMTSPPIAENFPARNRIISGLSLGVLVIEAAIRSGALITARLAAEEHHREVMAVPGRVDSQASAGCHKIIREGWASLVTNAADVLDALGETGQILRGALPELQHTDGPVAQISLNDDQRKLLDAINPEPTDLDTIARQTNLPVHVVNSQLTMLQLRGLVERVGGSQVRRRK